MVQLRELDGCGHSLTVLISVIRRALDKDVMIMAIKYLKIKTLMCILAAGLYLQLCVCIMDTQWVYIADHPFYLNHQKRSDLIRWFIITTANEK